MGILKENVKAFMGGNQYENKLAIKSVLEQKKNFPPNLPFGTRSLALSAKKMRDD